jgi:hypothetical protein
MSRLDDIEARLAALEAGQGGPLGERVKHIEDVLGIGGTHFTPEPISGRYQQCNRCGNNQSPEGVDRCPQEKCPLKAKP